MNGGCATKLIVKRRHLIVALRALLVVDIRTQRRGEGVCLGVILRI